MNFMQNLLKTTALFTLVLLFAISCKKDVTDNLLPEENQANGNQNYTSNFMGGNHEDEFDSLCFQIVYPITVVLPDGTSQSANSDDELFTIAENWYMNNPDSEEDPTLAFPIDVTLDDGTLQAINDDDELEELFDDCFGKWDDDEWEEEFEICFDIVYPVTVLLPDGTSQTANDDEELDAILFTWFENNPDSEDFPTFSFPIQVVLDSTIMDINDEEELEELFEECEEWDDEGNPFEDCFTISYPITIEFPDGTSATINSDEELEMAIENWYTNNPDSEEDPTLAYPVEVTLAEDGSVVTVTSDEELEEVIENCFKCLIANPNGLAIGTPNAAIATMAIKRQRIN